ncbi:MAG: FadR family transcriptional regulator [Chloroflexi bacterium]|nr:FadR family transcriptional regulator [Chloroflexota bacterium]
MVQRADRSHLALEQPAEATDDGSRRTDRITEALKRYIVTNRLQPGTRLPSERQLAEVLMVGRNAVREAIQSLAVLGTVEQRHGSGVYVCEFNPERLAEQLSYGLREDALYWRHLLEARIDVEKMVTRRAAARITEAQLADLRQRLELMRRQVGQEHSIIRTDQALHLELAACTANPVIERLARSVVTEYFRYAASLRLGHSLVGSPVSIQNHEPLLAALAAHDPDAAAAAMDYHFRDLQSYVDEVLEQRSRIEPVTAAL